MRRPRNPFRTRASEYVVYDEAFLGLFGPGFLELVTEDMFSPQVQIFRSAPGGGKTSLFRVFTPASLVALHERRRSGDDYKDLYARMKELKVVSESGVDLLGVMLSFAQDYAVLDDLGLDENRSMCLFHSLLNSRIVLATLRGALTLLKLSYPKDLDELTISIPDGFPLDLSNSRPARQLYEWACSIEMSICTAIDSFALPASDALGGHTALHALSLLRPESIMHNGRPVAHQMLVMFDDFQGLTSSQRRGLYKIMDTRPAVSVWIAERLEALSPHELLAPGVTDGREYRELVLERFWRGKHPKKFESLVTNIADRRAKEADEVHVGQFQHCLQDSLDGSEWNEQYASALETVSAETRQKAGSADRYRMWLDAVETEDGTLRERATSWRMLSILIERESRKSQTSLDFEMSPERLEAKDVSSVRAAAELFLAREFDLPHVFGMSRLASLSSGNIEQFLAFAGDLFEEILSAGLRKWDTRLTPKVQEGILKKAAEQRWKEIPRRASNGRNVHRFLEAIRQFTQWETYKPNAPYPPGVTGIAISMEDRDKLINPPFGTEDLPYDDLVGVLSTCISLNLLEPSLDKSQGQKGKTWMLLYLNRWLCLHFDLPLQYGGFRRKSLRELCKWLDTGFQPPKRKDGDLLLLT